MKHQTSENDQMQAGKRTWKTLVIAHEASKTRGPGKRTLNDPAPRQEHKTSFRFGKLDDFQTAAVIVGCLCRSVTGRTLVHKGHFDMTASDFLDGLSQFADLSSILLIGWGDHQRQQVAQCIDGRMHVTALAAPGSVIAGMTATFGSRLQRSAIQNGRRGLPVASFGFSQQQAQVIHQCRKTACGHPALRLLVDHPKGVASRWASRARARLLARSSAGH